MFEVPLVQSVASCITIGGRLFGGGRYSFTMSLGNSWSRWFRSVILFGYGTCCRSWVVAVETYATALYLDPVLWSFSEIHLSGSCELVLINVWEATLNDWAELPGANSGLPASGWLTV